MSDSHSGVHTSGYVDAGALDRLAGQLGDAALMRRLVDAYEHELRPRVQACVDAAELGDLDTLSEVAHRLVGTGAQLGVTTLTEAARTLERAAVDADSLAADDALADVVAAEPGTRAALLQWAATLD